MNQTAAAMNRTNQKPEKTKLTQEEKEIKKEQTKEMVFICVIGFFMALIFFAGLFLAGRFSVNEFYNAAYRQGYYLDRFATANMRPSKPEGYVQYYNTANNAFQNGAYEEAMNLYTKALEEEPMHINGDKAEELNTGENDIHDPECSTRINLALSILYQIDFKNIHKNDRVEVDQAVEKLLMARKSLTDGNCAHYTDNGGHNFQAEELKKEIDELLNQLNYKPPQEEEQQQQQPQQDEEDQKDQEQNNNQTQREKEIQRKLEEEMKNAKEEQAEAQRNRDYGSYNQNNSNGRNW